MSHQEQLFDRIRKGPIFLLIGQAHLSTGTGSDKFIDEILRKYDVAKSGERGLDLLLGTDAYKNSEEFLSWMQERCSRIETPTWAKIASMVNWNGIFSSAVDTTWQRAFRSAKRELHPVFSERYFPVTPRNRNRLTVTYLFGSIDRSDLSERPPLTRMELSVRRTEAIALLRRIPELLTPFGTLIVEGYREDEDWLPRDALIGTLSRLGFGQVYLFSSGYYDTADPILAELLISGVITMHTESLAECLHAGAEAGFVALREDVGQEIHRHRISIGDGRVLAIPDDLWRRVTRTATIVDDTVLLPPSPLSKESLYQEYRTFLSDAGSTPLWEGYARGFAFERDFESKLFAKCSEWVNARGTKDQPILLHGQTGSGKTIALGRLAIKALLELHIPVLFIERKPVPPVGSDIDEYCKWAEDCGVQCTLIIWDGMDTNGERYDQLLRYLASRGRNAVIVGSCYRISNDAASTSSNTVEADSFLAREEVSRFGEYLAGVDGELAGAIGRTELYKDEYFLVALYRLLPPSRALLRVGVRSEVLTAERRIQQIFRELPKTETLSLLATKLLEAGLVPSSSDDSISEGEIKRQTEQIEHLIGLIMVPGRFGLKVPIELLARCISDLAIVDLAETLKQIDLFRWHEDDVGNVLIGPRHPLEAVITTSLRLRGPSEELRFVRTLLFEINELRDSTVQPEIEFAISLLWNLGPNSPNPGRYADCYADIAAVLRKLREERGIENPRLMLQEATLLREAAIRLSNQERPYSDIADYLDQGEQILLGALGGLDAPKATGELKSRIRGELAATLATKARALMSESSGHEFSELYGRIRGELRLLYANEPANYYPLDILAWSMRDYLRSGKASAAERVEIQADLLGAFETATVTLFDADQRERFNRRRMELGDALQIKEMSDEAFEELRASGSSAGYLVRAYQLAGYIPHAEGFSSESAKRCLDALQFLDLNWEAVQSDSRCLRLRLQLWWLTKTGKPLFSGEKQTLPFDDEDWTDCLRNVQALLATPEHSEDPVILYIYALALFHQREFDHSQTVFRQVDLLSGLNLGRRRVIKSYLASDSNADPLIYHATVSYLNPGGYTGDVYVEEIRRRVHFRTRDFNLPEISVHDSLGPINIAFNFIGPIASPISHGRPNGART